MISPAIQTAVKAIVILVIPLAGLGALWATSEKSSREGTVWEVPIEGYDPRDLLRGHYIQFRYDWPLAAPGSGEEEGAQARVPSQLRHLCLTGAAPKIYEAIAFDDPSNPAFQACEHKLNVQPGSVYGYDSLTRGRLYVGQDRALILEDELADRDQRGLVTIRVSPEGVLTPQDIRFRPLTAQEREERNRGLAADRVIEDAAPLAREATSDEASEAPDAR